MPNIDPIEMIKWFRGKAIEFDRIADALQSTFGTNGQPIIQTGKPMKEVDVETIKSALILLKKPTRYSTLAQHLHADKMSVWKILSQNTEVFEQSGRGWWKLK